MTSVKKKMKTKEVKSSNHFKPAGVLPSLAGSRPKNVTIQAVPSRLPYLPPAPGSEHEPAEQGEDGSLTKSCFLSESEQEMPEMFSLSTSSVMSCPALQITRSEFGASASSLLQADLVRNQKLKHELSQLRLSDFFDVHGGPHFKCLSITFAAKQNREVGGTFGSTGNLHATVDVAALHRRTDAMNDVATSMEERKGQGLVGKAKAFLAASEARARDLLMTQERAEAILRKVTDEERVRMADVNQRRLCLLFAEIPAFETALPHEVNIKDLMPADLLEEQEFAAKQLMDRQNAFLSDKKFIEGSQMSWLFSQTEVLTISKCMQRWSTSTRGANGAVIAAGMDRPTFCRMLFELELVGEGVPYFWAVSLFDSMAQSVRLCSDGDHAATAPVLQVVNRFRLISVVDTIVRQHWERMNREKFLEPLKKFAKKLKAYCDPTSGDSKRDSLLEAPQGIKDQRGQAQGKDGKGKADAMTRSTHLTCRDRLISAMLIEPEVLHMVFCFQQQFTTLFNCYAPNGHMQFAELWQFCVDFRLTPRFITEQQLRRAYEAAECFTVLPPRSIAREPARGVSKMGGKRNRGQRSKPGASPAPSASFQGAKNLQPELKQENERERHNSSDSTRSSLVSEQTDLYECETAFGASAFTETLCRVAFLYLGFYGSTLQQSTTSYFKISWLLSYLRRMSCLLLDNLPDVPPAAPSGAAVLLVEQLPKLWDEVSPLPAGCPVTLQQPMPGPGNRKMTCRRRSKHETMAPLLRPSKQTRDAALSLKKQRTLRNIREAAKNLGKAAMVVKKMTDNQMLSAVIPRKLDDSSSEDEVQPEPGAGKLTLSTTAAKERIAALTTRMAASFQNPKPKKQKKTDPNLLPLEELFKTEGGQPAIVNGTCQLCGRNIEDGGNPACRGCSIVDSINLQAHPFARLLYPESTPHGAKILRPKIKPHVGERLRPSLWLPEISQLRNAETGQ